MWRIGAAALAMLSGCLNPGSTVCADGTVCPAGRACTGTPGVCTGVDPGGDGGTGDATGVECANDATCATNGQWLRMDTGTQATFAGVWALADTSVFAIAETGELFEYDGAAWHQRATMTLNGASATAIWGRSATELYVANGSEILRRWNGSEWSDGPSGANTLRDVAGTGDVIVAAGSSGTIVECDGSDPCTEGPRGAVNFHGIAVVDDDWVAVGRDKRCLMSEAGAQVVDLSGSASDPDLNAVAIASDGTVFAVGTVLGTGTETQLGVHRLVRGAPNMLVLEDAGPPPMTGYQILHDVWAGDGSVIAVGEKGAIYRRDTTWVVEATPDAVTSLRGITATAANLFVVGAGGTVLRRSR